MLRGSAPSVCRGTTTDRGTRIVSHTSGRKCHLYKELSVLRGERAAFEIAVGRITKSRTVNIVRIW